MYMYIRHVWYMYIRSVHVCTYVHMYIGRHTFTCMYMYLHFAKRQKKVHVYTDVLYMYMYMYFCTTYKITLSDFPPFTENERDIVWFSRLSAAHPISPSCLLACNPLVLTSSPQSVTRYCLHMYMYMYSLHIIILYMYMYVHVRVLYIVVCTYVHCTCT